MGKSIRPENLGAAIQNELTIYHRNALDRVNSLGAVAIKRLVGITRRTAPKDSGDFRKAISSETEQRARGHRFRWGARTPHYRRTHLLVNGHTTANGGRVEGDPFLENALAEVLPEYETSVEEALSGD